MNDDTSKKFEELDPTELRRLHEEEPELFLRLAHDALKAACIGKTPAQTLRLQRMQWVIDGALRKGRTPLHRLQIMEEIFYGRVYGDDGLLAHLGATLADLALHIRGSGGRRARS